MVDTFLHELWQVLLELSPSLLLGLFIAGLMHVYLPKGFVHRGLNRPDLRSVTRASLIGVPLPLCSCGVIPTALGLRREGASKGATTSFLISTPQTGVDSVLVSASFLGWPFALFKLAAAFVTGLIGGALVNRFTKPDEDTSPTPTADDGTDGRGGILGAVRYGIFDLLAAIDLWIIAGVLAAALITTLLPTDYLAQQSWSQGILGMLLVLAISVPLYVCTTGSVPIAASLIAAGMPPGTALVFLMAGPATNVATLGAVYRTLGGTVLGLYLGTVVVMSVALGMGFQFLLADTAATAAEHVHGVNWLGTASALVLIALLVVLSVRRIVAKVAVRRRAGEEGGLTLKVEGMSCQHCVASVKQTLEGFETVEEASPNLDSGLVRVRGDHLDVSALVQAVEQAGYRVSDTRGG